MIFVSSIKRKISILMLSLSVRRFDNRHGSLELTVYCPFWMINKTDLMLSYRVSVSECFDEYHNSLESFLKQNNSPKNLFEIVYTYIFNILNFSKYSIYLFKIIPMYCLECVACVCRSIKTHSYKIEIKKNRKT